MKLISTIVLISLSFSNGSPIDSKVKADHPGCFIWWFAPDCPLARLWKPDPFRIYPWGKFCKKYSAFTNTKFCTENDTKKLQINKQAKAEHETDLFDQEKKENDNEMVEPKEKRNNASNRRSTNHQPLEEMCERDIDFSKKHAGLCASIKKIRNVTDKIQVQ